MATQRASSVGKTWTAKKGARRAKGQRVQDEGWAETIRASLLDGCHPSQRDYGEDPSRFISALVGRGGGKTSGDIVRKIDKLCSIPNARLVYIALTRTQAENLYWAPLKLAFEQLGFRIGEDVFFNETKLTCTVARTGATLRLVGADKKSEVEKLRGQPFHEVTIDEVASFPTKLLKYLITEIVTPRLGDYNGVLCLIGSPGKVLSGLFYDITKRGGAKHRPYRDRNSVDWKGKKWLGYSSHAWNLPNDVVSVKNAEKLYPRLCNLWRNHLLEKEKEQYSDDNPTWRREYLGEWAADDTENIFKYRPELDGKLFNRWKPDIIALKGLGTGFAKLEGKITDYLFGYGLDLGSRDPFALTVLAFKPGDPKRRLQHVFGFERREMYSQEIAKILIGEDAVKQVMRGDGLPDKLGGLFGITGWPAAIVADLAGLGETQLLEMQRVYGIKIKGADKGRDYKYGAFEVVNGHFVDNRLDIIEGSDLETQLLNLQFKPDEYGMPREDKSVPNHSSDSLVYIVQELVAMFASTEEEDDKSVDDPYAVTLNGSDDGSTLDEGSGDGDQYSWLQNDGDYHALR